MPANPHIDTAVRELRDEIETIERNLGAAQRLLAQKQEALASLESLHLHTPAPDGAAPEQERKAKPAK